MARKTTRKSSEDSSTETVTTTSSAQPTRKAWEITYPNGATTVVYQESAAVRAQAEHGGSIREITLN